MPTRSYYFPTDFDHLVELLRAEPEGFSDDSVSYFRICGVPPIPSMGSLPLFLGISPKTIYSIRKKTEVHYRSFSLRKKDGTLREINTPRTYLKVIQWWILDNILKNVKLSDNVFGFVSGKSAIKNAAYHLGARHVLNVDIKQFFPSITVIQVCEVFKSLGYSDDVSVMLSELCCLNGQLPQGAPTSPAIANIVMRELDKELLKIAYLAGHKYSRYADDLTFSSHTWIEQSFLTSIQHAVEVSGFDLKPEKTRFSSAGARMEVTGVVINEKMQPTRIWRKKIRATLHALSKEPRLTRRKIAYLLGLKGMGGQFPGSQQMQVLSDEASKILENKSQTVIGRGSNPILPNGLTIRQAEVLAALKPRTTNEEIASRLKITEAATRKILQVAFKKIGVADRVEAERWASCNL